MKIITALLTITVSLSTSMASCPYGDISGNCSVGFEDLVIFAEDWLSDNLYCPETGLLAHWKFDENNSDFAYDSAASNDGTLYNNPIWQPELGRYNGALFFDGNDDYITIEGFKGISGKSARTCSAWINTNSIEVGSIINWGLPGFSGKEWDIRMAQNGTMGVLLVYLGNSWLFCADKQLNIGQWIHIAVVFPEGGNEISDIMLYINGELQTRINIRSTYGGYGVDTGLSSDVTIGKYGNFYFNGQIDDVRIYNRALSSAEIKQMYLTGSSSFNCPDLTGDKVVHLDDFAQVAQNWLKKNGPVIISEFLASNSSEIPLETGDLLDGNGESSDWIELHNLTNEPVNLSGWHLTDNADRPDKWTFPPGTVIDADEKLIVFASNKDNNDYPYMDGAGYYHTNFSLSASGEFLALVNSDGKIMHQFTSYYHDDDNCWGFPPQESDISYGILESSEQYFSIPTPGSLNRGAFDGFVADTKFSHDRGIYVYPFNLTISCKTDDVVIRYTLDGTDPAISNGTVYTEPIPISSTSTVRAAAFRPGYVPSNIDTHTYIFNPNSALAALPIFSLVGDPGQVFYTPNGIMAIVGGAYGSNGWYPVNAGDYNNVMQRGFDYEKPVSAEFLEFDGSDFHGNCGIRVHGSDWMRPRYRPPSSGLWYGDSKYSFRLYFRDEYGDTRLRYNLLPKYDDIDTFKSIVLRGGHNDRTNPFIRDEFIRRVFSDMGNVSSLGTFANVCINGVYKGYFNPCEHINDNFCQYHFNSEKEWDVMTMNGPRDGDAVSFNSMLNFAQSNNLSVADNYIEMQRRLDIPNFIDYIMVQTWGANWDWPQNNWSAASEKSDQGKWRFFVWDAEGCMDSGVSNSRFGELNSQPNANAILYKTLKSNTDYRQLWSDRIQKHFFNENGAMSQGLLQNTFWELRDEVIGVIPSFNTGISLTWIPQRESIYLNQCIGEGLFTFKAPDIFVNGTMDYMGSIPSGSTISMSPAADTSGTVYYTLDGTDPRTGATLQPGQGQATQLTIMPENAAKKIKVPTYDIGTSWRTNINYNDNSWTDGQPSNGSIYGGVGYENSSGYQDYIAYDVKTEMQANTSVYIRIKFDVSQEDLDTFNYMKIAVRVDDSAVFYLNGYTEPVYLHSYSGVPQWNSAGSGSEAGASPILFDITSHLSKLQAGTNFMAVHGLNTGTSSSDYLVTVRLIAGYSPNTSEGGEVSDTAINYSQTGPFTLNKSSKIRARVLNGNKWSALRESAFTVGNIKNNLRITEINYNPGGDPNEEFIELRNVGNETINLRKAYFSNGIDYTFHDMNLEPGQYMILAGDIDIFTARYGDPGCFIDQFEGALDNSGDKITIKSVDGITIQSVEFEDNWYDITDGEGFTLTPVDQDYTETEGLISLWQFDGREGNFTMDAGCNYTAGLMNFTVSKWKDGKIGNSLLFDGVDDYVTVKNYKGILGTHSRSVTAWIKTTDLESNGEIIGWGTNESPGNKFSIRLYNTAENHSVIRAEAYSGFAYGTTNLSDGKWHHIAVTLQNDTSPDISEVKIYVDGITEILTAFPMPVDTIADQDVTIGVYTDKFFNGKIDHLGIYNIAITQETVKKLAQMDNTSYDSKSFWRPSALKGGSPGRDDTADLPAKPGTIVINEILSHSHSFDPDWIELKNISDTDIDISGWYLSDAGGDDPNRMKFRIPDNTILQSGRYIVFTEDDHFGINSAHPGRIKPFGLSEGGETLYLQSGDSEGNLTGYCETESFGPAESNVAFGRFIKSTGTANFVAMSENTDTPPNANKYPMVGPILITEIHYNPGPGANVHYEFIELMNITENTVYLQEHVNTQQSEAPMDYITETVPWKFTKGIDFTFPPGVSLDPKERILIVKDIQSFTARFSSIIPAGTQIFQWDSGKLDNGGESIELSMPGDLEWNRDRYYIRKERVTYGDDNPWPDEPDGTGKSLYHVRPESTGNNYSNDPINWSADIPSPGY